MMNRAEFDRQAEAHRALHILAVRDGEAVFRADYDEGDSAKPVFCHKEALRAPPSASPRARGCPARRAADRRLCDDLRRMSVRTSRAPRCATCWTHVPRAGQRLSDGRPAPVPARRGTGCATASQPFPTRRGQNSSTTTWVRTSPACSCSCRAGCTLDKYLTPRLFEPLGITAPTWETDPLGYSFGAGGLFLCVSGFCASASCFSPAENGTGGSFSRPNTSPGLGQAG